MTADRLVVLELTSLEAAHLTGLVSQFIDLLTESAGAEAGTRPFDPAVARLLPDAYADDAAASREFREITGRELIDHRILDARAVLSTLTVDGVPVDPAHLEADAAETMPVTLDEESVRAWLRTLTALRFVLASRLGISSEDDHDEDDPRFGIYDWLGYRLDGLVRAVATS